MIHYSRRDVLQMTAGAVAAAGASFNSSAAKGSSASQPSGTDGAPAPHPPGRDGKAPVDTRMFWTWDHSTEWILNRPGGQTLGASNPYERGTDVFIEDYTRVLRWCGQHHINAVVVWGLLRDTHGGVEAAKKLCDVAAREGVRVLCGVGLNAYGGVYYEGESPYSLQRHLEKHPDLYGVDASGKRMIFNFGLGGPRETHHACPSRKENQEFATDSLAWLMKTLPLGGVQIETGDTGVCRCKRCQDRRRHPAGSLSWEDMALMYPLAAQAIRSVSHDAWIICETYSHPEPYDGGPDAAPTFGEGLPRWAKECLDQFPDGAFVQWVCDDYVGAHPKRQWTQARTVRTSRLRHIMRAHFGTYWRGRRGEVAVEPISDMVGKSVAHGFDAISLFGEVSPFCVGAELNYLALEHFGSAGNPAADVEVFMRDVAGPLLGGSAEAAQFLHFAALSDPAQIRRALPQIYQRIGSLPAEPARRWTWLANDLNSLLPA